MRELDIAGLAQGPIADTRHHLNQQRVAWYVGHFEEAEPVTVFDIGDELLLVDGYHRVAAAQRLGHTTVRADVRKGSRSDALRFAIEVGKRQRGVSDADALAAIRRRGGRR